MEACLATAQLTRSPSHLHCSWGGRWRLVIAVNGFLSCLSLGPPLLRTHPWDSSGTRRDSAAAPHPSPREEEPSASQRTESGFTAAHHSWGTLSSSEAQRKPALPRTWAQHGREARDMGNSEPREKQTPLLEMLSLATRLIRTTAGPVGARGPQPATRGPRGRGERTSHSAHQVQEQAE